MAILSLLVTQPVWAEVAEPRDEVVEEVAAQSLNPSTAIDQLLKEQRALSSRVAALEAATTEPRKSNEHWFSVAIALLGVVTFIHALRLRRLK
ncbi:MAG: hypothetical protein C0519_04645 [Hyphomicrobium sp.]|nr:hypothetical protein [Hyphomicrobium sp.]